METETIITVSVLGAAWLVLLVVSAVLCSRVASLRRQLQDLNASGRLRVQKLTMSTDKHAFNNPTLSPDEELSRRGYSMYQPDDDVESGRGTERQTGGQFVDELAREIDYRQQRQSSQHNTQQQQNSTPQQQQNSMHEQQNNMPQQRNSMPQQQSKQPQQQQPSPPFLLQSIENSKKIRALANPVAAQGRQSDTNPNFMY